VFPKCFFLTGKFSPKKEKKIKKWSDFGGFQSPEVRKKKRVTRFQYLVFNA
jgi:hypothetical protein